MNRNKKHLDMFKNKIVRIILHEGDEKQKKEDLMQIYKEVSDY